MALSPIGALLLAPPLVVAVLLGTGTITAKPARRLATGIAMIPLVPVIMVFLAGSGTGIPEDALLIIGFVTVAVLSLRLHWLIAAMKWKHAWLAHVPAALLNCALAGALFIWFVLLASFGTGGHH
jgi:hypothetical protein